MSHVDEGQLHAWLDGEFPATGGDEAAFEAHVETCALCLGRLERARAEREEADRILAFVAPAGVEIPPFAELAGRGGGGSDPRAGGVGRTSRDRRASQARMAVGWAATVVLALGGGWMARGVVMAPASSEQPGASVSSVSQAVALAEADADPGAGAGAVAEAPEAAKAGGVEVVSAQPPPPAADAASVPAPAAAVPPAAPTPQPLELPTEVARIQGRAPDAREVIVVPEMTTLAGAARARGLFLDEIAVAGADADPGVAARMTPSGVRIENNRTERVVYLVLDGDYAARARWVPCASRECAGVEPGDATEVSRAGVPGWQGSRAAIVFWWHLVPAPEGGVAPDSIRSIPVPYTPG